MKHSLVFLLLLFGISGHGQVAMAQSAGTFTAAGNMTSPRFGHTATLLPDGKVLIAGGFTACIIGLSCLRPAHAEIYDPATGTFTATGSMTTTAYADGAVLLPDGKVLIAAGYRGVPQPTFGVELYDPSSGEFHTAGKSATLKGVYSPALLNDGRVLLTGDNAELYDPVSGTFSPVANWPGLDFRGDDPYTSFYWYPVVLADGRVLLAPYDSLSDCKIYDPATGTFNLTGKLGHFLDPPNRTLLLNGAVLFTGGEDFFLGSNANGKLYDPLTGTFATAHRMSTPRNFHSATLLPDGTVLVAGGQGQSPLLASAEIYDPATSGFSTTGSLTSARIYHTATLLNNGQVLITGGRAFSLGPLGSSIDGNVHR